MKFKMECRSFLHELVTRIQNKSPLNYKLAKNLAVFDPRNMSSPDMHDKNKVMMKNLLQQLIEANKVCEQDADNILQQYVRYIDEIVSKQSSKFSHFNPSVNEGAEDQYRVDILLYDTIANDQSFVTLWQVVK